MVKRKELGCYFVDISFIFSNNTVCQLHVTMGEFGVYDVNLNPMDGDRTDCSFSTAKEPVDIYARKSSVRYNRQ